MSKIDVRITKARNMNGTPVNVGDEIKMEEGYFERAGFRFAEKVSKPTKEKKKYKDKEMVVEEK